MTSSEQVLEVFRRFDKTGKGTITRDQLSQVLKLLASDKWEDKNVDVLLENTGLRNESGEIRYEDFIYWVMACIGTSEANAACQAAYDGALDTLKGIVAAKGVGAVSQNGYVKVDAGGKPVLVGLFHPAPSTFELKNVIEAPQLQPANALQFAAFAGKTDTLKYLLHECGMSKQDEGTFGFTAQYIFQCHRLDLHGDPMNDDVDARDQLEEEEEPLLAGTLQSKQQLARSGTRTLGQGGS